MNKSNLEAGDYDEVIHFFIQACENKKEKIKSDEQSGIEASYSDIRIALFFKDAALAMQREKCSLGLQCFDKCAIE